jgi:hypothetical protein
VASLIVAYAVCANPERALANDGPTAGNWAARKTTHKTDNSAIWGSLFQTQVIRCWDKPRAGRQKNKTVTAEFRIRRDGTLEEAPVGAGVAATDYAHAYRESARRAIVACQPYKLPAAFFDEWRDFEPMFSEQGS